MNIVKQIVWVATVSALTMTNVLANDTGDKYVDILGTAADPDRERLLDDGFAGFSGRIGKAYSDRWNLELAATALDFDGDSRKAGIDQDIFSLGGNALAVFNRGGSFQPYFLAGLGGVDEKFAGNGGNLHYYYDLGVGALVPIFKNKGRLRAEVVRRAIDDTFDSKDWMLNIGFGVPFGKKAAAPVAMAAVAAPLDSDGDGVTDDLDQCPNTPAGAAVDARGCELDSDGDGVVDSKDKCPNTPAGTEVDADGCAIVVVINLEGVNFRTNSADLVDGAAGILDEQAATLAANTGIAIEVAGHTDADGAADYNQQLSQKRAEAVRDYLIGKGVAAERISAAGYGESEPVASNDTREGKAQNRRVELRIQKQ